MEITPTSDTFRQYISFWIGQLFSLLGSSIVQFVIIWWVTDETGGSPIYLSIASLLASLPMVILTPFAGVLIDRWNKKYTIIATDSLQALITFGLFLTFTFGAAEVWPVIIINSLRGVCQAIHFPTVNAIIPFMVPKDKLSRMNGVNYLFTGAIQAIGPSIGAFFLVFFPIPLILWVDIINFIIALIPLLMITIPSVNEKPEKSEKTGSGFFREYFRDFASGLRLIKIVPGLLTLFIFISIINFLGVPYNTLMPSFIKVNHNGGPLQLAIVIGMIQVGIIAGALVTSIKKTWKRMARLIVLGVLIGISGYLISTIAPTGNFIMIGIGGFIRASMVPIINTMFLTILQTQIPHENQGRVFSIVVAISRAVSPIGMLITGPLAELWGIPLLYIVCIQLEVAVVAITWFCTSVKKVRYENIERLD